MRISPRRRWGHNAPPMLIITSSPPRQPLENMGTTAPALDTTRRRWLTFSPGHVSSDVSNEGRSQLAVGNSDTQKSQFSGLLRTPMDPPLVAGSQEVRGFESNRLHSKSQFRWPFLGSFRFPEVE